MFDDFRERVDNVIFELKPLEAILSDLKVAIDKEDDNIAHFRDLLKDNDEISRAAIYSTLGDMRDEAPKILLEEAKTTRCYEHVDWAGLDPVKWAGVTYDPYADTMLGRVDKYFE